MIKIDNISKQFKNKDVLKNISFNLSENKIIGLIGENGSGKTTLLNIIAGLIPPDQGKIEKQNEKIEYLPQNIFFEKNETIEDFLLKKITQEKYYKIKFALKEVGLENININKIANNLSGGQKTRLYISSFIISDTIPTTLLLDEPTNNLDIDGIIWLEQFLINFKGNVLFTSHDRSLLDKVANKIIELHQGKIKIYGGNFSFYKIQKEIEFQAYKKMYAVQDKKIKKIQTDVKNIEEKAHQGEKIFSSRNPYQRRKIKKSVKQAVSRKNKLEKFLNSNQNLQKPEEKTNYYINLSKQIYSDKILLNVKNLSKLFDENIIFKNVTFYIGGKDRVWLSGLNGSGKTTLLKIINNEILKSEGEIEIGNQINIGYFSQDRQDLNPKNTIIEEFELIGLDQTESYKLAISFGFEKDELTKKINELSTGQKAKIAFAKLTTGNYQLLILDEPTNHLEIETREIIENALNRYKGGILVASHDKYFLEKIEINKIISL